MTSLDENSYNPNKIGKFSKWCTREVKSPEDAILHRVFSRGRS